MAHLVPRETFPPSCHGVFRKEEAIDSLSLKGGGGGDHNTSSRASSTIGLAHVKRCLFNKYLL